MTLNLSVENLDEQALLVLRQCGDRVMRITPEGESVYDVNCWESLRSDFCGIAVRCMGTLSIAGSPARVDQPNNVFGDSDILICFRKMISFVERFLKIALPHDFTLYSCSRIDFTRNYDLGGQIAVHQALNFMRHAETRGANNECNIQNSGQSIYWDKNSKFLSLKAYNKFLHAVKASRKRESFFTDDQLKAIEGLIRFELKIGRYFFARLKERQGKSWYELSEDDLISIFEQRLVKVIGEDMNVQSHDGLRKRFDDAALQLGFTQRMGGQAYNTFNMIKLEGYENVKRAMKRASFYRHQQIMHIVGLSKADICAGRLLEFRRKTISISNPVRSWSDLRLVG